MKPINAPRAALYVIGCNENDHLIVSIAPRPPSRKGDPMKPISFPWDAAQLAWWRSRPAKVQALLTEFPIGSVVEVDTDEMYVIGCNESDHLIVSRHWPGDDYEAATTRKTLLCAAHVRDGLVAIRKSAGPAAGVVQLAPTKQPT